MSLPANVNTGLVTGRFIVGVADGPDADAEPDAIPAQGTVTFTASVPYLPNPTATPAPVTILKAPIVGVLDGDGHLCVPDPADPLKAGARGVRLVATDDPDLSVQGWTWAVTYNFATVNGARPQIASHAMALPSGAAIDLTTVVRVPSSTGIGIEQAEALAAAAQADAQSASQAAQDAAAAALIASQAAQVTDTGVAALIGMGGVTATALDSAYRQSVSVAEYGASPTLTDNTAAFQAAMDAVAPARGEVFIPAGTYAFNSPTGVTIPAGVTVRGQHAKLTTTRNAPLLVVAEGADNVTIRDLTIEGDLPADLGAVVQNQTGIQAFSSHTSPITGLVITGCNLNRIQGTAIRMRNVHHFRVYGNSIKHHGYAAIGGNSMRYGVIEGNRVEGTRRLPTYAVNSYGIYVSSHEAAGPVGSPENPRSTDVMIRNNQIIRQAWSALDTHVGERISFIGNHVHDCPAYAINCVYISTSGADGALAPQDITISENLITYEAIQDTSQLLHTAILMRGSIDFANPDRERVTGVIRGNIIRRMGRQDDSQSGAIFVGSARGVVIQGNMLNECRSTGIQVRDSVGTVIDSNTITDLWRTTGQAVGVYLLLSESDITMDATITNNRFVRGLLATSGKIPVGASVNTNGISGSTSSSIVTVEAGNDWGDASMASGQVRTQKTTGTRTVVEGTAAPTGPRPGGQPWVIGDRVENSAPAPGAAIGWVCTQGGAPGIWRSYGQIAA